MEKQNKNCQDPILCSISPEPSAYGTKKTTQKKWQDPILCIFSHPFGVCIFFCGGGGF